MAQPLLVTVILLVLFTLTGVGDKSAVRRAISGSVLILLGLAAAVPDWDLSASVPASTAAVNFALIMLGFALLTAGSLFRWRVEPAEIALRSKSPFRIVLWVALFAWVFADLLRHVGPPGSLLPLGLFAVMLLPVAALGWLRPRLRLGRIWLWLDDRWLCPEREHGPPLRRTDRLAMTVAALLGIALTIWSNSLLAAMAGAVIATVAVHRLGRESGHSPRILWSPILTALGLAVFAWFVTTIAGSEIPWRFPGIIDTPFSDRAEATAILFLGGVAWLLLGLWPFHGAGPASALAIVGGALLMRWGVGLIPGGVDHAAPYLAIVAAVAAIHASATGRVGEYAAALGVLGVVAGGYGAWFCFSLATLAAVLHYFDRYFPLFGLGRRQVIGVLLLPALALVLPWSLRVETTMSLIVVLAGVALFRPLPQPEASASLG